jgi:hypothetical protein
MTRKDFENLKVGDSVVVRRGHDEGVLCKIRFIEDNSVLIEAPKDRDFKAINTPKRLRLTMWHELLLPTESKDRAK